MAFNHQNYGSCAKNATLIFEPDLYQFPILLRIKFGYFRLTSANLLSPPLPKVDLLHWGIHDLSWHVMGLSVFLSGDTLSYSPSTDPWVLSCFPDGPWQRFPLIALSHRIHTVPAHSLITASKSSRYALFQRHPGKGLSSFWTVSIQMYGYCLGRTGTLGTSTWASLLCFDVGDVGGLAVYPENPSQAGCACPSQGSPCRAPGAGSFWLCTAEYNYLVLFSSSFSFANLEGLFLAQELQWARVNWFHLICGLLNRSFTLGLQAFDLKAQLCIGNCEARRCVLGGS